MNRRIFLSIQILTIFFLFTTMIGCSDGENETNIEDSDFCLVEVEGVFQDIELDEMPTYLNGDFTDFYNEMWLVLKYPAEARENGVEGDCILNYEISIEGLIENVIAIQDPGAGIGQASIDALVAVAQGAILSPGILNEIPVRVKKELKIKFKLEG